jgi:predicted metal-dependent hydrolase
VTTSYTDWEETALWQAGVDAFNRQAFYECHEYLEALWMKLPESPQRQLVQGTLQIAVGYYHWQNNNYVGARNKLKKGLSRLLPLPERSLDTITTGFDTQALRQSTEISLNALLEAGESGFAALDLASMVPRLGI